MDDPAAKLMRGLVEAFVLESLMREPKHGYALMKELEDLFGDEPNRNRIYPLLSRLEDAGLVRGEEDPDSSRGKTIYHLTDHGEDRLKAYKRMPKPFQHSVTRFWTGGVESGPPPDEGDAGDEGPGGARGEGDAARDDGADEEGDATQREPQAPGTSSSGGDESAHLSRPVHVPDAPEEPLSDDGDEAGDDVPYPCPDARVHLEKDPRSGEVKLELEGCPMGAYDYCPACPVYKGIEGMRRLLFG